MANPYADVLDAEIAKSKRDIPQLREDARRLYRRGARQAAAAFRAKANALAEDLPRRIEALEAERAVRP